MCISRQEGVHQNIYRVMDVEVETEKGNYVPARSYQVIRPLDDDRRPSFVYLDVIIRGAKENGLPEVMCGDLLTAKFFNSFIT